MKSFYKICFLSLFFILGCATNKSVVESEKEKRVRELVAKKITAKDWTMYAQVATPIANHDLNRIGLLPAGSTANRILLNGGDYFKLNGDKISVDLPYYGTQQISGGYEYGASGYRFESKVISYKEEFNDSKKNYLIKIKAKYKKELLNITIKAFSNGDSDIYIKSSHRTGLNYESKFLLTK